MKSTIHKKNNLQYRLPRLLVTEIQFFFNNTGRMLFLLFNIAIPVVVEMILPTFIHKHI